MRPLIEALEVPTLIITDLDAATKVKIEVKKGKGKGERNAWKSARPRSGAAQETTNHALKSWLPEMTEVDKLMAAPANKLCHTDTSQTIAVSYQIPQEVTQGTQTQAITPSTFEDALALTNPKAVEEAAKAALACGMTRDFGKYIAAAATPN